MGVKIGVRKRVSKRPSFWGVGSIGIVPAKSAALILCGHHDRAHSGAFDEHFEGLPGFHTNQHSAGHGLVPFWGRCTTHFSLF